MSVGSLVGIALSSYLPGADPAVRAMVGGVLGGIIEKGINQLGNHSTTWVGKLWNNDYIIVINRNDDNSIYNKLERYIVQYHIDKMHACTLKPDNGEIVISLQDADIHGVMVETWKKHQVSFEIKNENISQKDILSLKQQIIIRSKTAKVEELQRYVESICQYRQSSRCLRIYRAVVETSGKDEKQQTRAYWSLVNTLTNKRINNTILSDTVEKEFYNDIDWFLKNQKLYDTKGIPYKRGYFLYGIPGTGKTSCIKAIANEYHLDIFSVEMNDLTTNSQFTLLMTRITELTGNRPYILALEDFDRAAMFDRWAGNSKLSFGSILNELDGVTETFGRVLFITANTRERFNNQTGIDALFRPGRIDNEIQLECCDKDQLERMVQHFTGIELKLPATAVPKKLTPAKVISALQQYIGQDHQKDLQHDIKSCEFWSELQKDFPTSTVTTLASNNAISTLQKRIRRKQGIIIRYNRTIYSAEHKNLDKTKEHRDTAQTQLKNMRVQLANKKRKMRQDSKIAKTLKKRTCAQIESVAETPEEAQTYKRQRRASRTMSKGTL